MCSILSAQPPVRIPVVNVEGATIVAFFPNAAKIGSEDADGNEALSDFEFYAERLKKPLSKLGIQFSVQYGRSFRIHMGSNTTVFTPKADSPGYYLIALGRKPHIEYGVLTDSDLLPIAKQYFGTSRRSHP
jgi:hypothetical protein